MLTGKYILTIYGRLDCENEGTVILQIVLLFSNGPPLNSFKIFPLF